MKRISPIYCCLIAVVLLLISRHAMGAPAVSLSVVVQDDGRVVATADARFPDPCPTGAVNYLTFYRKGLYYSYCSGPYQNRPCGVALDRVYLHGTHIFIAEAKSCTGSHVSESYTLTLDNTPIAKVIAPEGKVASPFKISGSALFTPTTQIIKGSLWVYINGISASNTHCFTLTCEVNTTTIYNKPPGTYTIKFEAIPAGIYLVGTDQKEFTVVPPECNNGEKRPCYTGPAGTQGVGICRGGTQTCIDLLWGACENEVTPQWETCNGMDDNCNWHVDEGAGPCCNNPCCDDACCENGGGNSASTGY